MGSSTGLLIKYPNNCTMIYVYLSDDFHQDCCLNCYHKCKEKEKCDYRCECRQVLKEAGESMAPSVFLFLSG